MFRDLFQGKFLQGAAAATTIQQGFQNARKSGKHKSFGNPPISAAVASKH